MNNLHQIAKALLNYEAVHGTFPPLYTTDDKGRPLVSWRALILPYLECQDIYEACRFDEPWNGPANAELARIDLPFMRCPSDPSSRPAETSYVAVVGPGTVWSVDEPIGLDDIENTTDTILLVEVAGSGIPWMEPRDLSLQDALRGINAQPGPSISSSHPGRVVVLFADGYVQTVHESLTIDELRDWLTFEKREPHAKAPRREEEVEGEE
jgi:prepilin-type processing-associated H-X9-DG protein